MAFVSITTIEGYGNEHFRITNVIHNLSYNNPRAGCHGICTEQFARSLFGSIGKFVLPHKRWQ